MPFTIFFSLRVQNFYSETIFTPCRWYCDFHWISETLTDSDLECSQDWLEQLKVKERTAAQMRYCAARMRAEGTQLEIAPVSQITQIGCRTDGKSRIGKSRK